MSKIKKEVTYPQNQEDRDMNQKIIFVIFLSKQIELKSQAPNQGRRLPGPL